MGIHQGLREIIFEEINDQVGRDIQGAVDQDDRQNGDHGLVVGEQGTEHFADRRRLHFLFRAFFVNCPAENHFGNDKDNCDDQGKPSEPDSFIAVAKNLDNDHRADRDDGVADTGTGTADDRQILTVFRIVGNRRNHGPVRNIHHRIRHTPEDINNREEDHQAGSFQIRSRKQSE